jgi:hypothetical protein
MLRKMGFLIALLTLPMFVFAIGDKCKDTDKIYVQLEDLIFAPDGIWFKNSPDLVRVGTDILRLDSFGYYVSKEDQTWICPKCSFLNKRPYPRYSCSNCGWPYD